MPRVPNVKFGTGGLEYLRESWGIGQPGQNQKTFTKPAELLLPLRQTSGCILGACKAHQFSPVHKITECIFGGLGNAMEFALGNNLWFLLQG